MNADYAEGMAVKKTVNKSCLTAGVAVLTAATIALVPSVAHPTPHPIATPAASVRVSSPAIELTAGVQPLSAAALPSLLVDWLQEFTVNWQRTALFRS